jgi:glycine dehydrogenase subunit 1
MRFIPHTDDDVREMLAAVGVSNVSELFRDVPADLRATSALRSASGLPEQDVLARLETLADLNSGAELISFLGAGAYAHFVPAVVDNVLQRAEFYSAYTPYQPEVSQGTLQAIFEFQTLIAMLFDLEVANASMYDGASAMAEAVLMSLRLHPNRHRVILARSLHPEYRQVTSSYLLGAGDVDVREAPFGDDGRIDPSWLSDNVDDQTAAVVVGYPNFFGVIEDLQQVGKIVSARKAALVTATAESLALAAIRPPGAYGVDIAVGEGQSFGIPLSYGGPGVGLFATRTRHVRSMPGRLVGEAQDDAGRRGYVLTLATREQHIRRERATSNICTNHGLMALAATVYLSLLGKVGLRRLALTNLQAAHGAQRRICDGGRWKRRFAAPFFNEFVVSGNDVPGALQHARRAGVLAGVPLARWYPELENEILLNVTEVHSPQAVDSLVDVLVS